MEIKTHQRELLDEERTLGYQVAIVDDSSGSHAEFFVTPEDLPALIDVFEGLSEEAPGDILRSLQRRDDEARVKNPEQWARDHPNSTNEEEE